MIKMNYATDVDLEIKSIENKLSLYLSKDVISIVLNYTYADIICVETVDEKMYETLIDDYLIDNSYYKINHNYDKFYLHIDNNGLYLLYTNFGNKLFCVFKTKDCISYKPIITFDMDTSISIKYYVTSIYHNNHLLIVYDSNIYIVSEQSKLVKRVIVMNLMNLPLYRSGFIFNNILILQYFNLSSIKLINLQNIFDTDCDVVYAYELDCHDLCKTINDITFESNHQNFLEIDNKTCCKHFTISDNYLIAQYSSEFVIYYDRKKITNKIITNINYRSN